MSFPTHTFWCLIWNGTSIQLNSNRFECIAKTKGIRIYALIRFRHYPGVTPTQNLPRTFQIRRDATGMRGTVFTIPVACLSNVRRMSIVARAFWGGVSSVIPTLDGHGTSWGALLNRPRTKPQSECDLGIGSARITQTQTPPENPPQSLQHVSNAVEL